MVGRMLNRIGYETSFAMDGEQAIEMYKNAFESENPFRLVILDLTIPRSWRSKDFTRIVENRSKSKSCSIKSNDPIMANFKDYGFIEVIPKPYTKSQLAEVMNKIFGKNV